MNGKTDGAAPHELAPGCERAADLVAFIYGEAGPAESHEFRLHLNACGHCREELAAFGEVRSRVVGWRAEALREAPALGLSGAFGAEPGARLPAPRVRSARAALREFFSLSPTWLRAAAVASLLVFCGLAALVFMAGAPERVVTKIERIEVPAALSDERVEALVRERVREELAAAEQRRAGEARAETLPKPAPRLEQAASAPPRRRPPARAAVRARPAPADEESLPRLSDLLSGIY